MTIDMNKYNKLTSYKMRADTLAQEMLMDRDPQVQVLGHHLESVADDLEFQRVDMVSLHGAIVEWKPGHRSL